jgi:KUP system potassium uptake protein
MTTLNPASSVEGASCALDENESHSGLKKTGTISLAIAALGVVYGDIGTSPLYAIKECFHGLHAIGVTNTNVLGVLSLVFWSLTIVICFKYVIVLSRADNQGEGGIFALLALISADKKKVSARTYATALTAAIFGAALLYGDGIITPAISVLSAIEGLGVATRALSPAVVPLTCVVLFVLFILQHRGTAKIGNVFGPIMIVWFAAIAILGLLEIVKYPQILRALNPAYAVHFFVQNGFHGIVVLGSVVLCITGGEALYADLGHFGRGPIQISWLSVAFPALVLNYFGQGALLLTGAKSTYPFYQLAPSWALYPLVVLAAVATVIASQSVISGVFSLSRQAAFLGLLPRLRVLQTSAQKIGQIYVSSINWVMMIATIALVLGFQTSSRLAGAYGVAVSTTMVITTILAYFVTRELWHWHWIASSAVTAGFLVVDLTFFSSNMFRIVEGGWVPLLAGAVVYIVMSTWKHGRNVVKQRLDRNIIPVDSFVKRITEDPPVRVPGTAVFMSASGEGTPPMLLHHLKLNKVLHEQVILLTITIEDFPRVRIKDRSEVKEYGMGVYGLILHFGFMNDLKVPEELERAREHGLDVNLDSVTYYVGGRILIPPKDEPIMTLWRENLFLFMARNAAWPVSFYGLPADRVIELGMQIEL